MTLRETHSPLLAERPDLRSAADVLVDRVRVAPDHVAFLRLDGAEPAEVTTAAFDAEVRAVAKGLVASGVQPGDRVAVMAPTRYEWAVVDFATWYAGGVVVPVYETSALEQATFILDRTRPVLAIAASEEHGATLADAARSLVHDLPLFTMDPGPRDLTALRAAGLAVPDDEIERRRSLAGPDDLATIVFTSGTTGGLKGVLITHGNMVGEALQVQAGFSEVVHDRATTVIILPLAHILARGLQMVSVLAGMRISHQGNPREAVASLARVQPTFMVVVPRVLDKIRSALRAKAADKHLGLLFKQAEHTAMAWASHLEAQADNPSVRPSPGLRARRALFDILFYRRVRALLGGRMEYLLSGAAPLERSLSLLFTGMGIPVIEGYGLTETTAPVTGLRPGDLRAGSVGVPIPGATVRISDDSEVLVKGVGVTRGYLDPADDADAFVDGFLRTGDLGSLDDRGRLTLHGRSKNLIVTASGKNVAPDPWESRVATDPLVSAAVMVGEGRPYLGALILIDPEEASAWAARRRIPTLTELLARLRSALTPEGVEVTDEALLAHIGRTVARANAAVSKAEQVRRFKVLLADTTDRFGTFTPTLKLKREPFLAAAAVHERSLYEEAV